MSWRDVSSRPSRFASRHGRSWPWSGALALGLALTGCGQDDHVHLLNGFDFPVKLTIALEEGGEKSFELPARGRVTTDVTGKGTVKVETTGGELIAENKAYFGKTDTDKKRCERAFNVQGAAAIVQEDIEYGTGFGAPNYQLKAGWLTEDFCTARWIFEDPPEKISVKAMGPAGRTLGWVHYLDDGSWLAAVNALLEDQGQFKSQSRGRAQRIVKTVVEHDPDNKELPALKERFAKERLKWPG